MLLDATLIRGVLLPATMKSSGTATGWLPKPLDWLPKVGHEGEVRAGDGVDLKRHQLGKPVPASGGHRWFGGGFTQGEATMSDPLAEKRWSLSG